MSNCENCGKCCRTWLSLAVCNDDIIKWENTDVMKYVVDGKIWFDPETKEHLKVCPFLKDNKCSIYPEDNEIDLRPRICGQYPMGKPCLNSTMNEPMDCGNGNVLNIGFFKRK